MVAIFLAEGFELIEALTPADYLKRAGIDVSLVSLSGQRVKSSCGVEVTADMHIDDFDITRAEAVVLPGGMPGAANLATCAGVGAAVDYVLSHGKKVAAICAAPALVLGERGLLRGKRATCFPSFRNRLGCGEPVDLPVVYDEPFLTGRAAGAAGEFAIKLIEVLRGGDAAENTKRELCL